MNGTPKTLCLIDGSGYIFRAFYALPQMMRSDGTPVNAVYGFTNMMMNMMSENNCSHILVVFDAARKNFRNDIYPEYKQNRKETPPELIPQFPLIRQATEAMNIPWIEMEGFEADDLIATYARIGVEQGWNVHVISADKDLMQLMTDRVSLFDPMKRKNITSADVIEKFGVPPDKVIEVQSLMGDSSDNVPGATGIGPKTAATLIQQFGNVENLLNNLDKIDSEKRREGLSRDNDQILISKQLVTLDNHAPVPTDLEPYTIQKPDLEKLQEFLTENNFLSLLKKIPNWTEKRTTSVVQNTHIETKYTLIQDTESLKKWITNITDHVAIDTETTGLDPITSKLVGISLAYAPGNACYIPLGHFDTAQNITADLFGTPNNHPTQILMSEALEILRPVLQDTSILKIGHNIKYDMHILKNAYGPTFAINNIADTMVISSILDGSLHGHGLDELARLNFNHTMIAYKDVCGHGRRRICFSDVPLDKATDYAAEDADYTLRLYHIFQERLETVKALEIYQNMDAPLIPILFEMEQKGILVDREHLMSLQNLFGKKLQELTTQIHQTAGEEFNINSPAQLGVILFEKRGLTGGKKGASGAWITDVKVLETLSEQGDDLARQVLDYRSVAKLQATYVDALLTLSQQEPRIHTSFSLTATNTGRLASSNPNLQNIPIRTTEGKEIRRSFIAKPGYKLLSADYSQIELRLMADVADVSALKESFKNNEDIHTRTASQVLKLPLTEITPDLRRQAKAINFGIIYGISAFGLANQLNISRTEAKQYIDAYFEQYPQIRDYMNQTMQFADSNGYVLTPFGRRCYLTGLNNRMTKAFAMRSAINAPIQGGAADILKMAMIRIHKNLENSNLDATMLLQVHDELVFEVAEKDVTAATQLIKSAMENTVQLSVPLIADVGVGDNWKDAH